MKKTLYILLTIFLLVLLTLVAHTFVEKYSIKIAAEKGMVLQNNCFMNQFYCPIPFYARVALIFILVIAGYYLGNWWWRIVYIEKRHWRFKK